MFMIKSVFFLPWNFIALTINNFPEIPSYFNCLFHLLSIKFSFYDPVFVIYTFLICKSYCPYKTYIMTSDLNCLISLTSINPNIYYRLYENMLKLQSLPDYKTCPQMITILEMHF